MIQIHNVTKGTTKPRGMTFGTSFHGTKGYPLHVTLMPGENITIHNLHLHEWHPAVKQYLTEYVAHGIAKVYSLNSTHVYQDKGNDCDYALDYLLPAAQALALEHALQVAVSLHTVMNAHFTNLAVHNAATAVIAAAVPTTLATLLVWIAAAQTAYDTVHRPDIPAHPHIEAVNALVPVVAIDLPTSIQALQELYTRYHAHKEWLDQTATELTADAILAF